MLRLFTIYEKPSDFPNQYVVREWHSGPDGVIPGPLLATALSLEQARKAIPEDADYCQYRAPEDDPCIVETWF